MTAVHELMSRRLVTVSPATSMAELLLLFGRHGYNALPVVETEGRLVGIVSKLDLLRPLVTGRRRSSSVEGVTARAADIMQRKVVSIEPQESIIDAGKLMLVTRLRSLPVIHRRSRTAPPVLVGMVSRGDLLQGLSALVKGGAHRSPNRTRAYATPIDEGQNLGSHRGASSRWKAGRLRHDDA